MSDTTVVVSVSSSVKWQWNKCITAPSRTCLIGHRCGRVLQTNKQTKARSSWRRKENA